MTKRKLSVAKPVEGTTLFTIQWDGGGELPDVLKGQYTSPAEAEIAIARYMSTVKPEDLVALMKKDDEKKQAQPVK